MGRIRSMAIPKGSSKCVRSIAAQSPVMNPPADPVRVADMMLVSSASDGVGCASRVNPWVAAHPLDDGKQERQNAMDSLTRDVEPLR